MRLLRASLPSNEQNTISQYTAQTRVLKRAPSQNSPDRKLLRVPRSKQENEPLHYRHFPAVDNQLWPRNETLWVSPYSLLYGTPRQIPSLRGTSTVIYAFISFVLKTRDERYVLPRQLCEKPFPNASRTQPVYDIR